MLGHWIWKGPRVNPEDYLGFIYVIRGDDWYYVGRKQIWTTRRGKKFRQNRWQNYRGSSNHLPKLISSSRKGSVHYEILGFFYSKSFLRYAEAFAIVTSLSYERANTGYNYSFDGARGPLGDNPKEMRMMNILKTKVKRLEREYRK